ncbi:hypothetical protein [Muribaculum sp. An287]|uniref:hypothetical protein n=1 Tax=Muribaculum sp. An287 TaxID=1965623 RepID=UPI001180EB95|nr:hypothetical protein [Muribaculum sp. An287]
MGTIKNVIICVLLCFVLLGCGNRTQKKAAQTPPPKYALREMLDSCLQAQPNANNNDVTRSIFADTLKSKIQLYKERALPYIEDVPMQYEMCLPYPNGQYVVKFGFGENTSKCKLSNDYKTTFQVFAIMDKEKVAMLVDGSLYYIKGIFRDFANNSSETGFSLPSGKYIVDYPNIISIDNKPYIDLGTLVVDSLSFTKINQE